MQKNTGIKLRLEQMLTEEGHTITTHDASELITARAIEYDDNGPEAILVKGEFDQIARGGNERPH